MCFAKKDQIQSNFLESDFVLRTPVEYDRDIAELPSLHAQGNIHSRGVKRFCLLNDIPGFHVTTNYSLDVMHIVMEGIISVELGCILYYTCHVNKYFSLSTLIHCLEKFWGASLSSQHSHALNESL